ncbi:MAG: DMT family transporter, partial [Aigarchaeota archaeon]|nr:DMT family transporter [Aigarchaeota archaeon]
MLSRHLVQAALAGAFFGTSSIFVRLMPNLSASSITFYRLGLASIFLAAAMLLLSGGHSRSFRHLGRLSVLGLLLGLHVILFTASVKSTTILNAATLVNTTPVWALVLSAVVWRQAPELRALVGTVVAFIGVAAITAFQYAYSPEYLVGDLMAVASAWMWAFYLSLARPLRQLSDPLLLMPFIYGVASLTALVGSVLVGDPVRAPVAEEVPALLGQALVPTALGHTLQLSSLKSLTPHQAATFALLEPVVATALGVAVFSEVPRLEFFAGAALVCTGIYIVAGRRVPPENRQ